MESNISRRGFLAAVARCGISALAIPLIGIALYLLDSSALFQYQRGNIDDIGLFAWRGLFLIFLSACIIWLSSRALSPKPGDLPSMAVGLVLCSVFIVYFKLVPVMYDFGLLYALLCCIYICALVVGLAGRAIA